MRWYQIQLRKPKRWARRAKSDGSAVPKLNRVKAHHRSAWFKHTLVVSACVWLIGVVLPIVLLNLYLLMDEYNLLFLIGVAPSINEVVLYSRLMIYAMMLSVVFINMTVWVELWLRRREARTAISHRCHLCPRCGYSLQSRTNDDQPCPECGQRISRREAVRLWARFCR